MVKEITVSGKIPTKRQIDFLRHLIRTQNPPEAARLAYHCKNDNCASVMANKTIKALGITLTELLDLCGLDLNQDLADLARLSKAKRYVGLQGREVDDHDTQLKTLIIRLRLKGCLKERLEGDQIHVHVNYFQQLVQRSQVVPEKIANHTPIETEAVDVDTSQEVSRPDG